MKKYVSIFIALSLLLSLTAISAQAEASGYTLTLTELGDGSYRLTATVPEGVSFGKLVISVSDRLSLREGTLTSLGGAVCNESYSKNGVAGACVVFTMVSALPEGTTVFTAIYDGAEAGVEDISAPEWHVGLDGVKTATQDDGALNYAFVPYVPSDSSEESSEESFADVSDDGAEEEDAFYTVVLLENGDGTYTVYATVHGGVNSGKLVISVSDRLSLVAGSLKSVFGGVVNESYSRGGVSGACVSFSTAMALAEGATVFTARYEAAEGAAPSTEDISAPEWNLGRDGVKVEGKVLYEYVSHVHSFGAFIIDGGEHYRKCSCGLETERGSHVYTKHLDTDCDLCGAVRSIRGDVNGDNLVDSLDSAAILKHDACVAELEGEALTLGDANRDGGVNNLDAVYVLRFDTGILNEL